MRKPGKLRKFFGTIFILLTVAFTVYLSVIMVQRINAVVLKNSYITIFKNELYICAAFLVLSLDIRFGILTNMRRRVFRVIGWIIRIALVAAACLVLFVSAKITYGAFISTPATADNAIVLGLALQNGMPVPDMIERVNTAAEFSASNPDAKLILTGGNANYSGQTEASVMKDLLVERGVKEDRLLIEDQASTTTDNFRNAAKMLDPSKPVVLITSDYHMNRAVRTAEEAGFAYVIRKPAPSSRLEFAANIMWEVIQELNRIKMSLTPG